MDKTTLHELAGLGQSVWLDYISRSILDNGHLTSLIERGLLGMTSNPAIFNQVISHSDDYDREILRLQNDGKSTFEIYDALTIRDIQDAADQFRPVYESTQGRDGYVSLEINPLLADKVEEQTTEGIRLFEAVARPNLMIKVPSTQQGFAVTEELIARGINVNVTLIFSLEQYRQTVQAYWRGLKRLAKDRDDLSDVHSVASVFISRIDAAVDTRLDEKNDPAAANLKGKAAVANAACIYAEYRRLFDGSDFEDLKGRNANVQRVLWGSTSTKNPAYSDVKYIEELIADQTVNTVPEKTLDAFLDHGQAAIGMTADDTAARAILTGLQAQGIEVDDICADLLKDGCVAFNQAFESLLKAVEAKARHLSLQSS